MLTGLEEGAGTVGVWTPELGVEDPCPVVKADSEGIVTAETPSDVVAVIDCAAEERSERLSRPRLYEAVTCC